MEIEIGSVVELENGDAYLINNHFMHDGQEYVAMVAINEPVHFKFAEVNESEDETTTWLNPLEDEEQINFFKQYLVNDFFSDIEMDEEEIESLNTEETKHEDYYSNEELYEEVYDVNADVEIIDDGSIAE